MGEDDKEMERFNNWCYKTTEFTEEHFFQAVKSVMSQYEDLEEKPNPIDHEIKWVGLTAPYAHSHIDDEGRMKERIDRLSVKVEARYDTKMCHIGYECSGHGENFGASSPCKTEEEISYERLILYLGTKYLKKRDLTKPRYEQMSLFEIG